MLFCSVKSTLSLYFFLINNLSIKASRSLSPEISCLEISFVYRDFSISVTSSF